MLKENENFWKKECLRKSECEKVRQNNKNKIKYKELDRKFEKI